MERHPSSRCACAPTDDHPSRDAFHTAGVSEVVPIDRLASDATVKGGDFLPSGGETEPVQEAEGIESGRGGVTFVHVEIFTMVCVKASTFSETSTSPRGTTSGYVTDWPLHLQMQESRFSNVRRGVSTILRRPQKVSTHSRSRFSPSWIDRSSIPAYARRM